MMSAVGSLQHFKAPGLGGLSDIMGRLGNVGPEGDALMRTLLSPSCAVINEWLACPDLASAATAFATHPQMPPWVPGSGVLACLLGSSHGGRGARPAGGTGALIDALIRA